MIRCLEVPGEATKRLSLEIREQNPQLHWHAMAGMRDVLIHAYDQAAFHLRSGDPMEEIDPQS